MDETYTYQITLVFSSTKDNIIQSANDNPNRKRMYLGLIKSELQDPIDVANRVLALVPKEVFPGVDKSARIETINVVPTIFIDKLYIDLIQDK